MYKITYIGTEGCPGHHTSGINYQMNNEECRSFKQFDGDRFEEAMRLFTNKEHKCCYVQCADSAVYGILYSVDDDRGGSHTYLFAEGKHTIEEMETIISNNSFLKKQFDVENRFKQNIVMKEYVKRLLDEEKDLRTKCEKLEAFISDEDKVKDISLENKKLMWEQFAFMQAYYKVLVCRIKNENVELLK